MKAEGALAPVRWYRSLRGFIKDATAELKKVVWPSGDELKAYTYLVLFVLAAVALWIGALEAICHWISNAVHLYG
jgi:preprotein translocase SecE subunit